MKQNQDWKSAVDGSIHRNEYLLNDVSDKKRLGAKWQNSYVAE